MGTTITRTCVLLPALKRKNYLLGVSIMTKIVIERRSVLLFGFMFAMLVAVASCAVILLLTEFNIMIIMTALGLLILLSMAFPYTRSKKEIIVIDEEGLTLNGNIILGPIPWDCISDANVSRIGFDKILNIRITNIPKLENIFGENVIQQKVSMNRKTGKGQISIDLDLCKLHGIDLEKIINSHARNCVTRDTEF